MFDLILGRVYNQTWWNITRPAVCIDTSFLKWFFADLFSLACAVVKALTSKAFPEFRPHRQRRLISLACPAAGTVYPATRQVPG